jgi:hypothetical protein
MFSNNRLIVSLSAQRCEMLRNALQRLTVKYVGRTVIDIAAQN